MFCTRACSSRRIDGETETKINKAKSWTAKAGPLKSGQRWSWGNFKWSPCCCFASPSLWTQFGRPLLIAHLITWGRGTREKKNSRTVTCTQISPWVLLKRKHSFRYDFPVHPTWSLWSRTKRAGNLLRAFYMNTCVHFPVLMRYNRFHFLHVTTFSHVLINAP